MANPSMVVFEFVLERLEAEPVGKRITILRALAAIAPNNDERACLTQMADALVAVQRKHKQLVIDFKRSAL